MAQAARKLTAKDTDEKLAHRRLTVLELAERLGNVAEACRRGGIDRTSFYDWKRRFQTHGLDGLKDLPPIARSHPMTTPPEVAARIEDLALAHGAPRLRLRPARGPAGPGGPAGLGDHRPEDPERQGARHPARALAGAGAAERGGADRADARAGGPPREAEPLFP